MRGSSHFSAQDWAIRSMGYPPFLRFSGKLPVRARQADLNEVPDRELILLLAYGEQRNPQLNVLAGRGIVMNLGFKVLRILATVGHPQRNVFRDSEVASSMRYWKDWNGS